MEFDNLKGIAIAIGVAILMITILTMALQNIGDNQQTYTSTAYVDNTVPHSGNNTALDKDLITTTIGVFNASVNDTVPTTNYTITKTTNPGHISFVEGSRWENTTVNVTYYYNKRNNPTSYNITEKAWQANSTFSSYFNVLVIMGVLVIIVGILYFAVKRND
jgi:hypothetical protein